MNYNHGGENTAGYLALYDFTNQNYHDLNKKRQTWRQISASLEISGWLFSSVCRATILKNAPHYSFLFPLKDSVVHLTICNLQNVLSDRALKRHAVAVSFSIKYIAFSWRVPQIDDRPH